MTPMLAQVLDPFASALTALALSALIVVGGMLLWAFERVVAPRVRAFDGPGLLGPRALPVLRSFLVLWLLASAVGILTVGATRGAYLLALPPVLLLLWAVRDGVEDVVAGVFIAFTSPCRYGDWIRVRDIEGEVVHLGTTHIRLRAGDDTEVQIPNRRLVRDELVNVSRATADTPVEIVLPISGLAAPQEARSFAALCAATSPYASLHKRAETFLEVDHTQPAQIGIRVRGYVFDSRFSERYRSHIVEAWIERYGVPAP